MMRYTHCLRQGGVAADAAPEIFKLTAEMLEVKLRTLMIPLLAGIKLLKVMLLFYNGAVNANSQATLKYLQITIPLLLLFIN